MSRRGVIFVAAMAACTALLAVRAEAQDINTGYGDYQAAGYSNRHTALMARSAELESEVARYRELANESLAGNAGGGCGACDGGCGDCCLQAPNWFDCCCCGPTWAFSLAGDAWRDITDLESSNNFGNRFTLEGTWDLGQSGVRGHVGMGYGLYDYHGRVSEGPSVASAEQQVFLTAGVYRRGCCCGDWTWAASYDFLNDNHYGIAAESIDLHQVRFLVGRMMNACNEFGVWGAFGVQDADYSTNATIKTQDQVNLYWRRYWDFGGQTMLYAGLANPNLTLVTPTGTLGGDDLTEVVLGLRGIAPLTCNIGLVGGFQYVIPSASGGINRVGNETIPASLEENWNVTVGVVWVRGCSLPVLPTADNGWMSKRARIVQNGP